MTRKCVTLKEMQGRLPKTELFRIIQSSSPAGFEWTKIGVHQTRDEQSRSIRNYPLEERVEDV